MPGAARKTSDAAPAAVTEAPPAESASPAQPEAAGAEEAAPPEPPAEEVHRPAADIVFTGQAQSAVAGIGLCDPGETKTVPAAVADEVCRGDTPQFTRAATA